MIVLVNRLLPRLLAGPSGNKFAGLCLWPFIIVQNPEFKKDLVFMNHERIHLRQQAELLVLPFFLWYGLEFLWRWFHFKNARQAYRNIGFEREAYDNEKNPDYLRNRKFFGSGGMFGM